MPDRATDAEGFAGTCRLLFRPPTEQAQDSKLAVPSTVFGLAKGTAQLKAMLRLVIPRIPLFRTLPRISSPLLPLASRLGSSATARSSLTGTPRASSSRLFHHFPARLASSPPPSPSHDDRNFLPPDASLSQRLKHLIKSYGWYALGVYLVLSAADFAVAFAGIHLLGADQVSRVATFAKESVAAVIHSKPPEPGRDEIEKVAGSGEAGGQEGLYAMLVLAYTVHKTLFLPLRVGLTAALTPRLVGWLRARGWAGGAGARRAATEMRERIRSGRNRH